MTMKTWRRPNHHIQYLHHQVIDILGNFSEQIMQLIGYEFIYIVVHLN